MLRLYEGWQSVEVLNARVKADIAIRGHLTTGVLPVTEDAVVVVTVGADVVDMDKALRAVAGRALVGVVTASSVW